MSDISIHELEAGINFWRARSPSSGGELRLCEEASALSKPYALLIIQRQNVLKLESFDPISRRTWESYVRLMNGLESRRLAPFHSFPFSKERALTVNR